MKRIISFVLAMLMLFAVALADNELEVSGNGTVMVEADRAEISLGVSLVGTDLAELQREMNQTIEGICAALEAQGVAKKDISTNYLYIYPQYDYSQEIPTVVGYSLNNNLTIATDNIDAVGTLIDAAFAAGANNFDSINFSVKDETTAYHSALALAVQDAMDKSKVIADAAGVQIKGIESIDESGNSYSYSNSSAMQEYATADSAGAGTTVRAAQIAVTANVVIKFEIN